MSGADEVPYKATECVHSAFEEQVRRTPSASAVSDELSVWSYARLNTTANQFARRLREFGTRRGDRVGLYAERSAARIAMMLGIAKAGATYVPLDPVFSGDRLARMAAAVSLVACAPSVQWAGEQPVVVLDESSADIAQLPGEDLNLEVDGGDVFYVPFTSGSTGDPKGVESPHRAVSGFFTGANYAHWGPAETWLHHTSMSWDGHTCEIYPSLLTGGHVFVSPQSLTDPVRTIYYAKQHGVTALLLPTRAFNTVVDLDLDSLKGLRWLTVGGEKASARHLGAAAKISGLSITSIYGSVETTVLATVQPVTDLDCQAAIPLGCEVGDRRVYVLDDAGDPVADGMGGELCVGGPGVARGYLNRPRLTAEKFVPDPFSGVPGARLYRTGDWGARRPDGVLVFGGRREGQVQLRGVLIETGELEGQLCRHPAVREAAVVLDAGGTASPRLVAFVVADGVEIEQLRAHLAERVPAGMVPAAFAYLPRLPLTVNGKLDRWALITKAAWIEVPGTGADLADDYEPPATVTERALAELWSDQLGVAQVGRQDDFFALGGHSLLGSRVIARVRREFDAQLTVRQLYDAPTLARFAEIVDAARGTGGGIGGIRRTARPTAR